MQITQTTIRFPNIPLQMRDACKLRGYFGNLFKNIWRCYLKSSIIWFPDSSAVRSERVIARFSYVLPALQSGSLGAVHLCVALPLLWAAPIPTGVARSYAVSGLQPEGEWALLPEVMQSLQVVPADMLSLAFSLPLQTIGLRHQKTCHRRETSLPGHRPMIQKHYGSVTIANVHPSYIRH